MTAAAAPSPGTLSLNRGYVYRERVVPGAAGRTVLAHLSERYRHSGEAQWRARIERGEVRVDGRRAQTTDTLQAGQALTWRRPPWHEPDAPLAYAVLFRDTDLLVVAKPRGLPTVPGGGFLEHTLLALVRRRYPEAAPCHRLGRGTSGLLVFSRTRQARSVLTRAWGQVDRVYRALVEGVPRDEQFSVNVPIGPVPDLHPKLGTLHVATPDGRRASTRVERLESREGCALVKVTIATGRPHQIRIHLAAAGHPLVGDPLYGPGGQPRPGSTALPGDGGYHLHAFRLRFDHPVRGTPLVLECAPPPELRRAS